MDYGLPGTEYQLVMNGLMDLGGGNGRTVIYQEHTDNGNPFPVHSSVRTYMANNDIR